MKNRVLYFGSVWVLGILVCIAFQSCDKVQGPEPTQVKVPDSVASLVSEKYPGASEVVLKAVRENELWEARFTANGIQYYAGLDPEKIIAEHKLISPSLPDSLEKLFRDAIPFDFQNAVFSDYREDMVTRLFGMSNNPMYNVKLTTGGKEYLIYWVPLKVLDDNPRWVYLWWMIPYAKFSYSAFDATPAEIPAVLANFAASKGLPANAFSATVFGDNNLELILNGCCGHYVIDGSGKLLFSNENAQAYKTLSEIPQQIPQRLSQLVNDIQNYKLNGPDNFRFSDNGTTGYSVSLLHDYNMTKNPNVLIQSDFDNDFKLVRFRLSGTVVRPL
ncbi:hypothetical protein [Dyadobacter sp. CY343]|uniref:hypothetical protein n=1 Tax=Dyadobacter sp. CY343 TaxID=2907299 RepID=UPI001F3639E9|nr:hypothetical protein [Dyadobacter sp. CY343]MCE7061973.1 hypothetical protein [Dyadobacter sp. CY343]